MSLVRTPMRRPKRVPNRAPAAHSPVPVPPVIPLLVARIADDDEMTVTIDGHSHKPEAFVPAWKRHNLVSVVNAFITAHNSPVRVVIHEADGSTFDDIVAEPIEAEAPLVPAAPVLAPTPVTREMDDAAGFLGGEEVAIAVVVRHVRADADGAVHVGSGAELVPAGAASDVMLFGRESGTCAVRRLP